MSDEAGQPYQPGSQADFERLYRGTYARLLRTLNAMLGPYEAEDCAQHTYLKAFKAWPSWKGEGAPEAWLYRIAINLAISYRRRRGLVQFVSVFVPGLEEKLAEAPAAGSSLVAALRRLPPELSAVVVLRYYHGYSNREIATLMRCSERTIGSRHAAALGRLHEQLKENIAELKSPERLSP